MASKISSATINETQLSQADPFVKMSVTAILSGMASKASGGDFVQGALSAMVVWLYNDFMTQEEFKRMQSIINQNVKRTEYERKQLIINAKKDFELKANKMDDIATYSARFAAVSAAIAVSEGDGLALAGAEIATLVSGLATGAKHMFLILADKFKLENAIWDAASTQIKFHDNPIIDEFYQEAVPAIIEYIDND